MTARTFGLIAAGLLLAAPAAAQKVNVDYDRTAALATYKTYSWLDNKNPDVPSLWDQRIVGDVDMALMQKGWRRAPREEADVHIVYHAGVKERTSIEGYSYGYGAGSWRWGGGGYTSLTPVVEQQGTLVLDMVNPKTNQLVWRGVANDMLSDKSEKNITKVQKAVQKLFAKFPPTN